jgi:hypothetical protein
VTERPVAVAATYQAGEGDADDDLEHLESIPSPSCGKFSKASRAIEHSLEVHQTSRDGVLVAAGIEIRPSPSLPE